MFTVIASLKITTSIQSWSEMGTEFPIQSKLPVYPNRKTSISSLSLSQSDFFPLVLFVRGLDLPTLFCYIITLTYLKHQFE